jgi:GTPase SAR1 family protein
MQFSVLIPTGNDIFKVEDYLGKPGLETIAITSMRVSKTVLSAVFEHVKSSRTVRNLFLHVSSVSDEIVSVICGFLSQHPTLSHVVLNFPEHSLSPARLSAVTEACSDSAISLLHLGEHFGTWHWNSSFPRAATFLGRVKDSVASECFLGMHIHSLVVLSDILLSSCDIDYAARAALLASRPVTELHLQSCGLTDMQCPAVVDLLLNLPDLIVLNLLGNNFRGMPEFESRYLASENGRQLLLRELYINKLEDKTSARIHSVCIKKVKSVHLVMVGNKMFLYADESFLLVSSGNDDKDDGEAKPSKRRRVERSVVMSQIINAEPVSRFLRSAKKKSECANVHLKEYTILVSEGPTVTVMQQTHLLICWLESRKSYISRVFINHFGLGDPEFQVVSKWLETATHVNKLSLRHNKIINLWYFVSVAMNNKSLTHVDLSFNNICSDESSLLMFVKYNTSVSKLSFEHNELTDMFPFVAMMENADSPVTELCIGSNPMCVSSPLKFEDSELAPKEALEYLLEKASENPTMRAIILGCDVHYWTAEDHQGPFKFDSRQISVTHDPVYKIETKLVKLGIEHGHFFSHFVGKNYPISKLIIDRGEMTREFAEHLSVFLAESTSLEYLCIKSIPLDAHINIIAKGLAANTSIETIALNDCRLSNVDCIAHVLNSPNNRIRQFNLSNNRIISLNIIGNALCHRGAACPIKDIHLFNNQIDNYESFMYSFSFLRNLDEVNLYCNRIHDVSMLGFALTKNTSLRSLNLGNNPCMYTEAFGKAVAQHSNINTLDISMCQFVDFYAVGALLKGTPVLTELILMCVKNTNVSFFAHALAENNTLTTLSVAGNEIFDISTLGGAIARNKRLENLYLQANRISDVSLFAHGLAGNTTLKNLYMATNMLTSESSEHILRAILCNPNSAMVKVDLGFNKIVKVFSSLSEFAKLMVSRHKELDVVLDGNPLIDIDQAVYSSTNYGKRLKLLPFLSDIVHNGDVPDTSMKLVFAGNGNVGKTTLFKNLCSPGLSTEESLTLRSSTHGIETKKWTAEDSGQSAEFTVLDFAGQMEYFQLHSHFLPVSRAFYLICYDGSEVGKAKDKKTAFDASIQSWVSFIHSNLPREFINDPNPDSISIYIVQTKMDKVPFSKETEVLLTSHFKAKFPNVAPLLKGFFSIDYTNVDSVIQLRRALIQMDNQCVKNLDVCIPRAYSHIINSAIPAMQKEFAEKNKFPVLSLEKFKNRLEKSLSSSSNPTKYVPRKDTGINIEIDLLNQKGEIFIDEDTVVFDTQSLINFLLCFLSYRGENPSSNSHHIVSPGGIVTFSQVIEMCKQYKATEEEVHQMVDVLLSLKVVNLIENEESLFVPMALEPLSEKENQEHFPYREGVSPLSPSGRMRIYSYVMSVIDPSLVFPLGVFSIIQNDMISKFGVRNSVIMRCNFSKFTLGNNIEVSVQMVENQRTLLIHAAHSGESEPSDAEHDQLSEASQAIVNIVIQATRKLSFIRLSVAHLPEDRIRGSIFSRLYAFGVCPLCASEDCTKGEITWSALPSRRTHNIGAIEDANLQLACRRHPSITLDHILRPMMNQNMMDWIRLADWDPEQYFENSDVEIPHEYKCPLSKTMMKIPMKTPHGMHYERAYIVQHLTRVQKDPYTSKPLEIDDLVLDAELQDTITEFIKKQQEKQT